jgi:hypothetical protein
MTDQHRKLNAGLAHALGAVEDEKTFLQFLAALAENWENECEIEKVTPSHSHHPGALGWENESIGAYLDAAFQWGDSSSKGLPQYEVPANPWRRVADILYAGKMYE